MNISRRKALKATAASAAVLAVTKPATATDAELVALEKQWLASLADVTRLAKA